MKQNGPEYREGKFSHKAPSGLKGWSISAIKSIMKTKESSSGRNSGRNSTKKPRSQNIQNSYDRDRQIETARKPQEVDLEDNVDKTLADNSASAEAEDIMEVITVTPGASRVLGGETDGGRAEQVSPEVAKDRRRLNNKEKGKRDEGARSTIELVRIGLGKKHIRPMGLQGSAGRIKARLRKQTAEVEETDEEPLVARRRLNDDRRSNPGLHQEKRGRRGDQGRM